MRARLREALSPTDPVIIEVGAGGEKLVSRMRVVFWGAVWLIPSATMLSMKSPPPEVKIGLVAATAAVAISVILVLLANRYRGAPVVALITTSFDVTLVSATLIAIALAGRPAVAVNSHVVWPLYLLAIVATAFRFDYRVCALAASLVVIQYVLILFWVAARWDVTSAGVAPVEYGAMSWPVQAARLMLVIAATALAAGLIHQGRKLAKVSGTDRLTGLGSRALFEERLAVEIARAKRSGNALSLAFLDLDHFKRFNDRWGHDAGDAVLRGIASVLRGESRLADAAFRWGGEEIVIIFPETQASGAVAQLERARAVLQKTSFEELPAEVRVTVSAGVAEYPRDGSSAEQLTAAADRRLYDAKRAGRDRVVAGDAADTARARS